jgi:hypothetical protein
MAEVYITYKGKEFITIDEPPSNPWFVQDNKLKSGILTESAASMLVYLATTTETFTFNWGVICDSDLDIDAFAAVAYINAEEILLFIVGGVQIGSNSVELSSGDGIIFYYIQTVPVEGYGAWISIGPYTPTIFLRGSKSPGKFARI